jgi:hypothetical protein
LSKEKEKEWKKNITLAVTQFMAVIEVFKDRGIITDEEIRTKRDQLAKNLKESSNRSKKKSST